jgi:hypothetical protein
MIAIHDSHVGTAQPATCTGQSRNNLATCASASTPKMTPVSKV